jgi:hypothetical protein
MKLDTGIKMNIPNLGLHYCSDEIGILPQYFFETLKEKRLRKTFGLRLCI